MCILDTHNATINDGLIGNLRARVNGFTLPPTSIQQPEGRRCMSQAVQCAPLTVGGVVTHTRHRLNVPELPTRTLQGLPAILLFG